MGTKEKDKDFRYGIIDFEKRGYPRVKVRLPIEYRRVDSATKQSARTGNVSEGGFGIFFPERLADRRTVEGQAFPFLRSQFSDD